MHRWMGEAPPTQLGQPFGVQAGAPALCQGPARVAVTPGVPLFQQEEEEERSTNTCSSFSSSKISPATNHGRGGSEHRNASHGASGQRRARRGILGRDVISRLAATWRTDTPATRPQAGLKPTAAHGDGGLVGKDGGALAVGCLGGRGGSLRCCGSSGRCLRLSVITSCLLLQLLGRGQGAVEPAGARQDGCEGCCVDGQTCVGRGPGRAKAS